MEDEQNGPYMPLRVSQHTKTAFGSHLRGSVQGLIDLLHTKLCGNALLFVQDFLWADLEAVDFIPHKDEAGDLNNTPFKSCTFVLKV